MEPEAERGGDSGQRISPREVGSVRHGRGSTSDGRAAASDRGKRTMTTLSISGIWTENPERPDSVGPHSSSTVQGSMVESGNDSRSEAWVNTSGQSVL